MTLHSCRVSVTSRYTCQPSETTVSSTSGHRTQVFRLFVTNREVWDCRLQIKYVGSLLSGRQYEQLKERIQKSMKTLPIQKPYTWKSVKGCAVIGSDMLWHRGELLELLGGHVKVNECQ